jgi:hypothetical protein
VLAGNIGGAERLSYALVGDPVNLASRIQGLTKDFQVDILISDATRSRLDRGVRVEELPAVRVKGRAVEVNGWRDGWRDRSGSASPPSISTGPAWAESGDGPSSSAHGAGVATISASQLAPVPALGRRAPILPSSGGVARLLQRLPPPGGGARQEAATLDHAVGGFELGWGRIWAARPAGISFEPAGTSMATSAAKPSSPARPAGRGERDVPRPPLRVAELDAAAPARPHPPS